MTQELLQPLHWEGDSISGVLLLLDQTQLPTRETVLRIATTDQLCEAILMLRVRGAPAIGLAGAYGLVLALQTHAQADAAALTRALHSAATRLAAVRPTARNLAWAVQRVAACGHAHSVEGSAQALQAMLQEARAIETENTAMCAQMARHGANLMQPNEGVLTHCNTGPLATGGCGSALGVVFAAHANGLRPQVFADETRPLLQGARLTAYELSRARVPVTVLCDGAAAALMASGRVQRVLVGADRITANGDSANKIGTYGLAVLARAHGIPFHVVAPSTTFDLSLAEGTSIPIEQRSAAEVCNFAGVPTAPNGVAAFNPAFDVTPAHLITSIICERGVIAPVSTASVRALLG